jgi:hypothetical protein
MGEKFRAEIIADRSPASEKYSKIRLGVFMLCSMFIHSFTDASHTQASQRCQKVNRCQPWAKREVITHNPPDEVVRRAISSFPCWCYQLSEVCVHLKRYQKVAIYEWKGASQYAGSKSGNIQPRIGMTAVIGGHMNFFSNFDWFDTLKTCLH